MTMTSFAVTLYLQCCQHHVVGQWFVSDISIVCSCWSICSLNSESDNANLLLCLLIAVLGMCNLLHIPNITWPTTWQCVLSAHIIFYSPQFGLICSNYKNRLFKWWQNVTTLFDVVITVYFHKNICLDLAFDF